MVRDAAPVPGDRDPKRLADLLLSIAMLLLRVVDRLGYNRSEDVAERARRSIARAIHRLEQRDRHRKGCGMGQRSRLVNVPTVECPFCLPMVVSPMTWWKIEGRPTAHECLSDEYTIYVLRCDRPRCGYSEIVLASDLRRGIFKR